jgi:lysophospholipase L1-like esterase
MSHPIGRLLRVPALVLASVALTLSALEVGFRLFSDPSGGFADILKQSRQARESSAHQKSDDPELIYVTRPDYVADGVRISEAHGILQSSDVPVAKPPGTFRIAVLGDSIAAGHTLRVRHARNFAETLEELLNARGGTSRFEVLNFGTDGYGTLQEARLLETRVSPFAPDLLLVQYCLNDPSNSYTPTVWFIDAKPRSYLLDFVRRRLGLTPSELSPAHPRYTHGAVDWQRLYEPAGASWQGVVRGFARIAAWAKPRGVPVVVVIFPLLLDEPDARAQAPLLGRIHAQVGAAAVQEGFRVLDLAPVFGRLPAAELREIPGDQIHPDPRGHELAARAILELLLADRLVPETRSGPVPRH